MDASKKTIGLFSKGRVVKTNDGDYGHVNHFTLNALKEVVVVIEVPSYDIHKPAHSYLRVLHPNNLEVLP